MSAFSGTPRPRLVVASMGGLRRPPRSPLVWAVAAWLVLPALGLAACDRGTGSGPGSAKGTGAPEGNGFVNIGPLQGRFLGGPDGRGGGDGPLVLLLHGYGAEPDDLAGVARQLQVPDALRFLLLAAPVALPQGGRAWWPLDLEERRRVLASKRLRDLSDEVPDGLDDARLKLMTTLRILRERPDVREDAIAVVGFSQGAMAATDLALHAEPRVQAVGILAGTLLAEALWQERALHRRGLPTFIAHGESDRLLPFEMARRLEEVLRRGQLDVRFHAHPGGHEIPGPILAELAAFLTEVFGTLGDTDAPSP